MRKNQGASRDRSRRRFHQIELLETRRLLDAVAWTGNGDGSNWNDLANWSNNAVPTSADDVTIDVPGSVTVLVRGSQTVNSIVNKEEIRLQGDNNFGGATLSVTTSLSNEGTLRFESRDAGYGETIIGTGTITNTGSILSNTGAGGADNYIYCNLDNSGTINVQQNLFSPGNITLNQNAGSIVTGGSGIFRWAGGTVNYSGGTLGSKFFVASGNLHVFSTAPTATINTEGATHLVANDSANVTVWVQGDNVYGTAYLYINGTVNNSGTIRLQNTTTGYGNYLYPEGDSPKLVNLAGATIRATGDANSDYCYVSVENHGTIDCQTQLSSGGALTLDQMGGAITTGSNSFTWNGGTVNFSGGTIDSGFFAGNCALNIASTAPTATINAVGSVHLLANDSPNVTVWVQGSTSFGSAYLTINGSISNSGTILLQPAAAGYQQFIYPEGLSPLFNNLAGGTVRSVGGANLNYIYCNTNNAGTIDCDADFGLASSITWNQNGGAIDTSGGGKFRFSGGRFNLNGGTVGSGATFSSCTIDVTATAPTNTLYCYGACILLENLSSNVTLSVLASSEFGSASLQSLADMTHDGSLTNNGTILLSSLTTSGQSFLTVTGTLTNNGNLQTNTDNASYQIFALADISGTGSISMTDNATMNCGRIRQNAISLSGRINVANNGGESAVNIIKSLSLTGNGTLNLTDNDLIVDYSVGTPITMIQGWINSARPSGWTGVGLTSTAAQTNPKVNTTLGAMEASDYKTISAFTQTFDGQVIDNTAVLIKYTYYGDANFNGRVDGGDYSRIDGTFNKEKTAGPIKGWFNGDFDGNGKVDGADYGLIDYGFNTQGAALRSSAASTLPASKFNGKPRLVDQIL